MTDTLPCTSGLSPFNIGHRSRFTYQRIVSMQSRSQIDFTGVIGDRVYSNITQKQNMFLWILAFCCAGGDVFTSLLSSLNCHVSFLMKALF